MSSWAGLALDYNMYVKPKRNKYGEPLCKVGTVTALCVPVS